jgi:hypothetical protein
MHIYYSLIKPAAVESHAKQSSSQPTGEFAALQWVITATIQLLIYLTLSIIGVELTIRWNNIQGVYSLNSAGQLIPFFLGAAQLLDTARRGGGECLKYFFKESSHYTNSSVNLEEDDDDEDDDDFEGKGSKSLVASRLTRFQIYLADIVVPQRQVMMKMSSF